MQNIFYLAVENLIPSTDIGDSELPIDLFNVSIPVHGRVQTTEIQNSNLVIGDWLLYQSYLSKVYICCWLHHSLP